MIAYTENPKIREREHPGMKITNVEAIVLKLPAISAAADGT